MKLKKMINIDKIHLLTMVIVMMCLPSHCWCQFFTKTQKSIPRMGRSIDQRTLVLMSKLMEKMKAPVTSHQYMLPREMSETGYRVSRASANSMAQFMSKNNIIHKTRHLMSLTEDSRTKNLPIIKSPSEGEILADTSIKSNKLITSKATVASISSPVNSSTIHLRSIHLITSTRRRRSSFLFK